METALIISCEHAGNQVPLRFQSLFHDEVLQSHRGWDEGALDVAMAVATQLDVPCYSHQTTRLLVETNRSLGSSELFSEYILPLGDDDKQLILDKYYFPYRLRVEKALEASAKPVIHVSVHSFMPGFYGAVQTTDVGILFDLNREFEGSMAKKIKHKLDRLNPTLRVDFNQPHNGTDDGFTAYLRTRFSDEAYAGIQLEINQKTIRSSSFDELVGAFIQSLHDLR